MKSSVKNCSKTKSISEKANNGLKVPRQIEPGLFFSKRGICAAFLYKKNKPKVVEAFKGNETFDIKIESLNVFDIFTLEFSNGLSFQAFDFMNCVPLEALPYIKQRGPQFQMPYVVVWVDKAAHNVLREQHGRLSHEATENLCALFERRLKEMEEDPQSEFESV
jgi:hypothetical protein